MMQHEKIDHYEFEIRYKVQLWIRENPDGKYEVWTKHGLPGHDGYKVATTNTYVEARAILDARKTVMGPCLVEGSEIDIIKVMGKE